MSRVVVRKSGKTFEYSELGRVEVQLWVAVVVGDRGTYDQVLGVSSSREEVELLAAAAEGWRQEDKFGGGSGGG